MFLEVLHVGYFKKLVLTLAESKLDKYKEMLINEVVDMLCVYGIVGRQTKCEREKERQFLSKMNEEGNNVEKHQEKAVETAKESKNLVQGKSYVGGRVLQ